MSDKEAEYWTPMTKNSGSIFFLSNLFSLFSEYLYAGDMHQDKAVTEIKLLAIRSIPFLYNRH